MNNPGYVPQALTATNARLTVWRQYDQYLNGKCSTGLCSDPDGLTTLARPPDSKIDWPAAEVVPFWDGIEALWGVRGGKTYVRFRNGEDPSTLNVRVAPSGGTITFKGAAGAVVRDLEIGGGQQAIQMVSGASHVVVTDNRLRNGRHVVSIDGGTGNQLLNNAIEHRLIGSTPGYAATPYEPSDWSATTYARRIAASIYRVGKFNVGASSEGNAATVMVTGNAVDALIRGNTIKNVLVGVFWINAINTMIVNNHLENCSAQCIWAYGNQFSHSLHVAFNTIVDGDHGIRIQEFYNPKTIYIYGNLFIADEPVNQTNLKHIHINWTFEPAGTTSSPAVLWVYHNTFVGAGWALDNDAHTIPCARFINNVVSYTGTGGISQFGQGNRLGVYIYNWTTGDHVGGSGASGHGCTGASSGNNLTGSAIWRIPPMPGSFALPAGHAAKDSGLRLDQPFTLGGSTYPRLPGVPAGTPDRGAVQ
jgi:hypothetical protein